MDTNLCPVCGDGMRPQELNNLPYWRCTGCRFLMARTQGVDLDHYAHKEAGLSPEKVRARHRNSLDRLRTMGAYGDLNNLCDIGAGEGNTLAAAYECGYRNLVGVEPAAYVDTLPKDERFTLTRGVLDDFAGAVKKYDLANTSMFHVIEHLPDPAGALRQIFSALPPGGTLMIETPDSDAYSFRKSGYRHDLIYPEHVSLFNSSNLKLILQKAGFAVVGSGRRDFDPPLSIHDSFVRLGLAEYRQSKDHMQMKVYTRELPEPRSGVLRTVIRRTLYLLVKLFKREDYIWTVAQKI